MGGCGLINHKTLLVFIVCLMFVCSTLVLAKSPRRPISVCFLTLLHCPFYLILSFIVFFFFYFMNPRKLKFERRRFVVLKILTSMPLFFPQFCFLLLCLFYLFHNFNFIVFAKWFMGSTMHVFHDCQRELYVAMCVTALL